MAGYSIRKNDMVVITAGKEKGKRGKVLKVIHDKERVVVEKVNFIKRHTKPSGAQRQGGIVEMEGPIHISNVMLLCEKCGKGVRVRNQKLEDGSSARICAGCGESLS